MLSCVRWVAWVALRREWVGVQGKSLSLYQTNSGETLLRRNEIRLQAKREVRTFTLIGSPERNAEPQMMIPSRPLRDIFIA